MQHETFAGSYGASHGASGEEFPVAVFSRLSVEVYLWTEWVKLTE